LLQLKEKGDKQKKKKKKRQRERETETSHDGSVTAGANKRKKKCGVVGSELDDVQSCSFKKMAMALLAWERRLV
jgi:hypothetical protein